MSRSKSPDPFTPRKLPQQGRAAQTVTAILEAAAHILEDQGLEGYNTNAIAARAGASIGSIYQYFGSKDAITMALVEVEADLLLAALHAALALADPQAALDAMIAAAADHQLRRPQLARLLDLEERRLNRLAAREDAMPARVHPGVVELMERIYGPHAEMPRVCADIVVITRALCDAAPGDDADATAANAANAALRERIRKAVRGYLREEFDPPVAAPAGRR